MSNNPVLSYLRNNKINLAILFAFIYTVTGPLNVVLFVVFGILFIFAPVIIIVRDKSLSKCLLLGWMIFFGWHLIRFFVIPLLCGQQQFGDELRNIFVSAMMGWIPPLPICGTIAIIQYMRSGNNEGKDA
tara:strand:- start:148 stop:537 length:390 start_codon:yes stop_codon:yes gene_type:complete